MIEIKVPPLGESITEATVSRWLKQEGDSVAIGDTLVELETDKITVEVPALNAGVLRRRVKAEGDVVQLAETLGQLEEGATGNASPAKSAPATEKAPEKTAEKAPEKSPARPASDDSAPRAAPSASKLAAESGVDLGKVPGTGRGGVISKADVMAASGSAPSATPSASAPKVATPAPAPRPAGERETREKLSTRRKRIAENLLQAQHSTAHLTTFNEIDMSAVAGLRERMKEKVEKEHGVKLSYMPFFAKAACLALKAYPVVNSQIDGESVIYKHYVNLGIAVASEQGLVVPNIKDADRLGMIGFSRAIGAVAKRARDSKLTMDDLTGGSFTITNGGVSVSSRPSRSSTTRRSPSTDTTISRTAPSPYTGT
jgi:2-oxoglutarate dehydrogenase E2 component (dihydrolipoamide succinyltransferase)